MTTAPPRALILAAPGGSGHRLYRRPRAAARITELALAGQGLARERPS